ncbi:hypothetical protein C0J52_20609 [Blattella germanica]|nr:hypothetical protein C0J52_20609 [Blattella germanica]
MSKTLFFVPPLPANLPELRDGIINAIAAIDMDTLRVYGMNCTTGLMSAGSQGEHTSSTYNYVKKTWRVSLPTCISKYFLCLIVSPQIIFVTRTII